MRECCDGDASCLEGVVVLVVDDEPDSRDVIAMLLEQHSATVRTAADAPSALEAVIESPPHIIVSDIAMPSEDGYSLIRKVRALPPDSGGQTPAIALTAFVTPADQRAALDAGFDLHLRKPTQAAELVEAIAKVRARV